MISLVLAQVAFSAELKELQYDTIGDNRTFERPVSDLRYSVWTTDVEQIGILLKQFNITANSGFRIKSGQVFAIFLNDTISEEITAITYNETANQTFADYADSGLKFKLEAPREGMKYTHATAVIFLPRDKPSHLGIRSMVSGGISEKK